MRGPRILSLLMVAHLAACTGTGEGASDTSTDTSTDCLAGDRDPLWCDLIYLPYVVFQFEIEDTGEAYCGPASISAVSSRCDWTGNASCQCVDGSMLREDVYSELGCHINPPPGETTEITVSVEGYQDFVTEVSLPYQCHPREDILVLLTP